jgi:hypothetical protein
MSEEIEYLSQEEIDRAEALLKGSKKYYVYYTDEGEIVAIVKEPKDWAKNVLEVDEENVLGFLKGEKTTYTYKINKPALKDKAIVTSNQLKKFSKSPLSVIDGNNGNEDLIITHNYDLWKIKLNKDDFNEQDLDKKLDIFVAVKDNHNFLLNTLSFKIKDAINGITFKFKSQHEQNFYSVELLTKKVFPSYGTQYEPKS